MTDRQTERQNSCNNIAFCIAWLEDALLKMICAVLVAVCPSKFIHVQVAGVNGCYSFGLPIANWSDAVKRCKSLHSNSHLVAINNAAEQTAVVNWWQSHPGERVDNHGSESA